MQSPAKTFVIALVSAVTFAFGAAPATAVESAEEVSFNAAMVPAAEISQTLSIAESDDLNDPTLDTLVSEAEAASTSHGFDVDAAIALAESEIGTSRATGWSQPGECIISAKRWIHAGGGAWTGSGNPVNNYIGATRLTISDAQPGDIVQYEHLGSPTSWVSGVHTLMIVETHDDGTFDIIESNIPTGSGVVQKQENWTPEPPAGFQAVVWRF